MNDTWDRDEFMKATAIEDLHKEGSRNMNIQEKRYQLIDTANDHFTGIELEQYIRRLEDSDKAVEEEWELAFGNGNIKPQQITSTEDLWFWSYFDGNSTTTSLIIAETREEAYEIAIKKRMEWAKMNRTGAEKWFRDLDWLEKVTNHKILES